MSKPVAARVKDETKQWLESRAEQEDITVSRLAGTILDSQSGDVNDSEPDSVETELNRVETELKRRVRELEQDITLLTRHAEDLELAHFSSCDICSDLEFRDGKKSFPRLPGNDEGNVYGDGKVKIRNGSYRNDI